MVRARMTRHVYRLDKTEALKVKQVRLCKVPLIFENSIDFRTPSRITTR